MKKLCAFGVLCGFVPCFAAGESIAVAIEMKSLARMQLALADVHMRNEKIDGTNYVNQLADSWYAGTAWWKHAITCGAGLVQASRAVLGSASLKYVDIQNAEAQLQAQPLPMGKEWYVGYVGSITGRMLVSVGIFAGWYAVCNHSKRVHIDLARMLIISPMVTIDQNKLTSRAHVLFERAHKK